MNLISHFELMASYNKRMNFQVYGAALTLNKLEIERDSGAYFKSILGTLNHNLVGDILWLRRFKNHSVNYLSLKEVDELPKPSGLSQIIYPDIDELHKVRQQLDDSICDWVSNELTVIDLERNLIYKNSKGIESSRNFFELLCHFFNHQTHHRGQVSTQLNQLGLDIGVTDFLIDIPEN